jgi:hypothetical protein
MNLNAAPNVPNTDDFSEEDFSVQLSGVTTVFDLFSCEPECGLIDQYQALIWTLSLLAGSTFDLSGQLVASGGGQGPVEESAVASLSVIALQGSFTTHTGYKYAYVPEPPLISMLLAGLISIGSVKYRTYHN